MQMGQYITIVFRRPGQPLAVQTFISAVLEHATDTALGAMHQHRDACGVELWRDGERLFAHWRGTWLSRDWPRSTGNEFALPA